MSQNIATIRSGQRAMSMVPTTFDELQRMARMFVVSGTFKPSYKASDERALAECCIVIQRGLDVGLSPTQAVEGIAIINGKTLIYGDTLTAVLWAHGCKIEKWHDAKGEDCVAYARITRPDGTVIEKSFSAKEAKAARLWDSRETVKRKEYNSNSYKDVPNDAPWHRFGERMCEWRAFGFAVKDGASDYSKGLSIVEEMAPHANEPVDVTPHQAPPIPDIPDAPEAINHEPEIASIDLLERAIIQAKTRDELAEIFREQFDGVPWGAVEEKFREDIAELYDVQMESKEAAA